MTEEERKEWFGNNILNLSFFEKRTKIDFLATEDEITYQMESLSLTD